MRLQKFTWLLPLCLFLCAQFFFVTELKAEESFGDSFIEEEDDDDEFWEADPWDYSVERGAAKGDKFFNIDIGLAFGLSFVDGNNNALTNNLGVGGMGVLAFDYMLNKTFSLGGELSGTFNSTLGENILYMVPFGLRLGLHFNIDRFEFPLICMIGAAMQTELSDYYFSMSLKFSPGAFFRLNDDWSFGLNASWLLIPQLNEDPSLSVWGNFLTVSFSARYHF